VTVGGRERGRAQWSDAPVDVVQRRLALQPALGFVFKPSKRTEWKEGERERKRKRELSEKRGRERREERIEKRAG
jgi:hypothetical protein